MAMDVLKGLAAVGDAWSLIGTHLFNNSFEQEMFTAAVDVIVIFQRASGQGDISHSIDIHRNLAAQEGLTVQGSQDREMRDRSSTI